MSYINYDTKLFTDVWESYDDFEADYNDLMPLYAGAEVVLSPKNIKTFFYLMYAKYGNSPIANNDEFQWKMKLFGLLYSYGPVWQKKLAIQKELRDLDLSSGELFTGNKAIYNHALNPASAPSTDTLEEIEYIDAQNTAQNKKGKVEGLMQLWDMLRSDLNEQLIGKFKKLFSIIVKPEMPAIYITED